MTNPSRVALVTGATGGFGSVLARVLAEAGLVVYGTGRSPGEPDPDSAIHMVAMDASREESVAAAVRSVLDREGRIDVVVNCVNEMMIGTIEEQTADEVARLYDTNVFGVLRIWQHVLPAMRAQGEGVELVMATWSVLSVMVMLSPFVWRPVLAASAGGAAIALTLLFTALGTLLPLLLDGATGMLLSASLFGLAFFMVPTAVTNFSKKNYPQAMWGAAVSLFTTVFAIGQMIGPATAGLVADYTNSLAPGLTAAGGVLIVGAVFGLLQRRLA